MLGDLDQSLAAFLRGLLPDGTAVRFDPPVPSWVTAPPQPPLLAAYLYDVREAPQPPAADIVLTRDENDRAIGWQRPVRRYRVSYLLSAWAGDAPGREHELLGAVLAGCAVANAVPPDCLWGSLSGATEPVLVVCSPADPVMGAAQHWSALGVPARTALDLMVLAPVIPPLITELAPPVEGLALSARNTAEDGAAAEAAPRRRRITE